jgi:ElaB/YqjD/DUF883 family membrane-anchored ribosome-binding protein
MPNPRLKTINQEFKTMVTDARDLLHAASSLTGEKARNVHKRGLRLLDMSLTRHQAKRSQAKEKEIEVPLNDYLSGNPWGAITAAAVVGILAGLILELHY